MLRSKCTNKWVLLQFCHHFSLLNIFLGKTLYNFNRRSLPKYELGELSREKSKVWSFAFDGFLLSKSYKVSAKRYRRVISHEAEECAKFKKNWLVVSNLTQPPKSLKISFPWAPSTQSIQGLSYKNTEGLSFMIVNNNEIFEQILTLRF